MDKKDTYEIYPITIDGYVPFGSSYIFCDSFLASHSVKRISLDIIEFFARHGPNPGLAITEGPKSQRRRGRPIEKTYLRQPRRKKELALPYDYKTALRDAKKLERMGLLRRLKPKGKKVFSLTFQGFYVHMRDPSRNPENLEATIKSNYKLLPFSHSWDELIEIAGKQIVHECLTKAISEKIYKTRFRIEELELDIDLVYVHPERKPAFQINEGKKVRELLKLLSETKILKTSYLLFLAVNDILTLIEQKKWPKNANDLINLESEKTLAYFEKRGIHEKTLFIPGKRLIKFLKSNYKLEFFFTGMFMDKLLSEVFRG